MPRGVAARVVDGAAAAFAVDRLLEAVDPPPARDRIRRRHEAAIGRVCRGRVSEDAAPKVVRARAEDIERAAAAQGAEAEPAADTAVEARLVFREITAAGKPR